MADENPIETMTPGQILAEASVADFIKSMGLSIAEAQKALDLNSIAQIDEYTQPRGPNNKSLLDLGLSPPFYHYQHADLSVSLQLIMKVGTTKAVDVGVKVDGSIGKGASGSADARTAQITLKSQPASVTVDGTKSDATGADLDAAGNALADKLRAPAGKFEQAYVSAKHTPPKATLDPGNAKNPILTPGAVAFLRADASSGGIIRIVETPPPLPNPGDTFKLATGKETTVTAEANKLLYARKVVTQINALGGFKARLAQDSGGASNVPDAPGTLGIALFDTGKSVLKKAALEELERVARLIKDGGLTVDVFGYTDTQGSEKSNVKLGKDRADVVAAQLRGNGVPADKVRKAETGGEAHWQTTNNVENQQFRRAEIVLAGSTDLLIIVDSDGMQLQAKPTPDKTGGGAGNGFIVAKSFAANPVDGKKLKLGDTPTDVDIKGDAVATSGDTFAEGTPDAFAFNLARDINAGTATHKARATQRGNLVILSSADDAITIDLVTVSGDDIKLSADGGAEVTKPLKAITPAGGGGTGKTNYSLAVGVAVSHRTSRQFEQSVNGNSAINARLVAVPAPVEFLDEIRKFLGPDVRVTPDPQPVQTPTPAPTP
jgi:outer membrane protein OmpA-like peptidoglycan-associated protein